MSRSRGWNILHTVANQYVQRLADWFQKVATYLIIRLIPFSNLTWTQVSRDSNLESYVINVQGRQMYLPISSEVEAVQDDFQFKLVKEIDDSIEYVPFTPLEGVSFYATPRQMGANSMLRISLLDNSQRTFCADEIPNYDS